MRKLLLLLLLVCSMSAWAQDVIVKKDGSTIVCRVVEVNQTEVVYKRWSNLEGPNYVMNLADISAINYENGEKVRPDAQTATEATTTPLLQSNNDKQTVSDEMLLAMIEAKPFDPIKAQKKAKKLKIVGFFGGTMTAAGVVVMGMAYNQRTWEHNVRLISGSVFMVCGATMTSACLIRAYNLNKKAQLYTVSTSPLYENEFKLKNGASLATGVDLLKDNKHNNPTFGLGLRYNF